MHPRSPFKDKPPDFRQLAKRYPELIPVCKDGSIDFRHLDANRLLAQVLFKEYFELNVVLSPDRLPPTVPCTDRLSSSRSQIDSNTFCGLKISWSS